MNKRAFTLIEILVVIIVITVVLVIAFPAYKSTQLKSDNDAAQAIMIDLANAVRMYELNRGVSFNETIDKTDVVNSSDCSSSTFTNAQLLFACGYMQPFKLDTVSVSGTNRDVYRGYQFYVCSNGSGGHSCCDSGDLSYPRRRVVMDLADKTAKNRFGKTSTTCAWVDRLGNVGNNYDKDTAI
ncbi:prepilin-type N-terminal cleavage/methylation domain-containing protein [Parelusimicrobium proximum]